MAPPRRARIAVPVVLALLLSACTGGDDDGGPDGAGAAAAAAATLATGLASGDLTGVGFTDVTPVEATDDLREVVAGLGDVTPDIEVVDTTLTDDGATATLQWSWPLLEGADPWAYTSTVTLRPGSGADDWAVVWGHDVVEPSLTAASVLDVTPVSADRGDIPGAGGRVLVTERPVVRVGIDRTLVPAKRAGAAARALARLVDVDPGPFAKAVEAAGEKAFVAAITYREDDVPAAVADADLRGLRLVPDEIPLAPTREFAAPILGTVGEVTAEMIAEDPTLQVGDVAGISGLQARYDEQLRGADGLLVKAVASDDRERRLARVGGRGEGEDLATSLSLPAQELAERVLADVGPASALVAIRPSDGAILAAANGPGNGGQNFATFGQYAPGSTFKIVSTLALLRAGVGPEDVVPCTATVDVDGRDFENYDDYPAGGLGDIPLATALANSCNTAFIAERDRLDDGDLAAAAASLGLGIDHDLGFPAYFGSVPAPEGATTRAAQMIGQGTILASPMTMAAVIASVQAGETVVPRLLAQVDVAVPDGVAPLTADEADTLRTLLRGVVTGGSGRGLADVPGPAVIAKTGTAEFEDGGEVRTHAWMVAAQGDLAVAVFVAEGSSGSGTAGPLLEEFLRGLAE
ncbi:penicillin-binding transpeptidase domain-containing protein [Nocardioides sp.]|uniref:penicillin-binding transpeptidase domain-containing protein n=1 Tax=Nocardioides sp. TaxID=35761 RepID=UPI003517C74C